MRRAMLFEELLLVGYHGNGKIAVYPDQAMNLALAGGVLAELVLSDRIWVQRHHPKVFTPLKDIVRVSDPTPLGDPETDHALNLIHNRDHTVPTRMWIFLLNQQERYLHMKSLLQRRLLDRYVHYGILRTHQHKVLGLFPTIRYPANDPLPQQAINHRLSRLLDGVPPDPRTATLMLLAEAVSMGFDASFQRVDEYRRVAKQLRETEWAEQTQCDGIKAIIAAIGSYFRRGLY